MVTFQNSPFWASSSALAPSGNLPQHPVVYRGRISGRLPPVQFLPLRTRVLIRGLCPEARRGDIQLVTEQTYYVVTAECSAGGG